MNAIHTTRGAELLWFGNTLVSILVSSARGSDGICVMAHRMPFGDSPPMHIHRNEDEVFHVLSGSLRFRVAENERLASAGETLLAPKGVPHSYRVESTEGAHCLTITCGRDFEAMVRAGSRPAERADLPPAAAPTPEMVARLTALCARHRIDIVGAPLS